MKKPKSKVKQMSQHKRGVKRNQRLKESRKKVAAKKNAILAHKRAEKHKFSELTKKMQEARAKNQI